MEAPPIITPARQWSVWWLIIALLLLGATVVLYLFNPAQNSFYPRCTLYVMTGLYCPGCGSLRALHQLTHGHILTALHDNLLLVLALPVAGIYSWRFAFWWLTEQPLPRFIIRPIWIKILVAVVILFTVLRNIPAAPFNWLAPQ
jgi:hypothetical protein